MGKSRSLTLDQRHRVLGMLEGGMLVTAAARQIGVHHSTVSRLRSRYEAIGLLKDCRQTGRLRKTLELHHDVMLEPLHVCEKSC